MIKSFLNISKNINNPLFYTHSALFSIYSNQHQRATDILGDKTVKYDYVITEYDRACQAFVEKRWTTKEELRKNPYLPLM